jgi:hypothetical protein
MNEMASSSKHARLYIITYINKFTFSFSSVCWSPNQSEALNACFNNYSVIHAQKINYAHKFVCYLYMSRIGLALILVKACFLKKYLRPGEFDINRMLHE